MIIIVSRKNILGVVLTWILSLKITTAGFSGLEAQESVRSRHWGGTQGPNHAGPVDHGRVSDCSLGAKGRDRIG